MFVESAELSESGASGATRVVHELADLFGDDDLDVCRETDFVAVEGVALGAPYVVGREVVGIAATGRLDHSIDGHDAFC